MTQETHVELNDESIRKIGPYTLVTGILLALLGTVGIILPGLMSLFTTSFIAALFLIGATFWGYHTWKSNPRGVVDWLKPALLLLSGGLMLFYPLAGVAAVGLMLAIYLLLDSFGSFALAQALHPAKGWGWMAFNGVVSLLLAMLFLIGWPETSMLLVGIYVGISLIFDGWALIFLGWAFRKGKLNGQIKAVIEEANDEGAKTA